MRFLKHLVFDFRTFSPLNQSAILALFCRGPLTLRKHCTEGQTPEPLLEGRGDPGGGGEDLASEQPRYHGLLDAHTRTANCQDGLLAQQFHFGEFPFMANS